MARFMLLTLHRTICLINNEIGQTIVSLKYRDMQSQFVVGVATGRVRVYIFNLISAIPLEFNHGSNLSALEVF